MFANWTRGRMIRRGLLAAVCLLSIILFKGAGVFIAFLLLVVWGAIWLGVRIFKGGTRYIARTNAEEIAKATARPQPPAGPPPTGAYGNWGPQSPPPPGAAGWPHHGPGGPPPEVRPYEQPLYERQRDFQPPVQPDLPPCEYRPPGAEGGAPSGR